MFHMACSAYIMDSWETECVCVCVWFYVCAGWHLLSAFCIFHMHFFATIVVFVHIWDRYFLCLSSVLNRTPVHLIHEIILVDDFSDDGELQLDTQTHTYTNTNTHIPGLFQVRDKRDETHITGQRDESVHSSSWVHSFRITMKMNLHSGSKRRLTSCTVFSHAAVSALSPERHNFQVK